MKNEDIKTIQDLGRKKQKTFLIRWEVTQFCNYSCDFCIQGSKEMHMKLSMAETPSVRKDIAKALASFIERNFHFFQTVSIRLIGGEVTALPDFMEILSILVCNKFRGKIIFHITTNFFRPARYFSEMMTLFNNRRNRSLTIGVSYYRHYVSMDVFGQKLRDIQNSLSGLAQKPNVSFSAAIPILDDESYRSYQEFRHTYGRYVCEVLPIILRNYPVSLSADVQTALSEECILTGKTGNGLQVSLVDGGRVFVRNIQHLGNLIEDKESFYPYGYFCDAGKNGFSVSPDGSVFRCPVLNPPTNFFLGKLTKGTFRLLKQAELCYADHCSCSAFSMIKK